MYKVFTYGTLMKQRRNHFILENSKYLGDAILDDYGLYELGTFPGAVKMLGYKVYGEVYEVDEKIKELLDELEDVGNLYDYIDVDVMMDDKLVKVGFYRFNPKQIEYPVRKLNDKWNQIEDYR